MKYYTNLYILVVIIITIVFISIGIIIVLGETPENRGLETLLEELKSGKTEVVVDYPIILTEPITIPKGVTVTFSSPILIKNKTGEED